MHLSDLVKSNNAALLQLQPCIKVRSLVVHSKKKKKNQQPKRLQNGKIHNDLILFSHWSNIQGLKGTYWRDVRETLGTQKAEMETIWGISKYKPAEVVFADSVSTCSMWMNLQMHRRPQFLSVFLMMDKLKACVMCFWAAQPSYKPFDLIHTGTTQNCCGAFQPGDLFWSHSLHSCLTCDGDEVVQKSKIKTPFESSLITGLDLCYSIVCLYFFSPPVNVEHFVY